MKKSKAAYSEILNSLNKHKDHIVFNVGALERASRLHLYGLKLKEVYGLNINERSVYSEDWNAFNDHLSIGFFDGERRKISWPDSGKQPNKEQLLQIGFSSGAYILGDNYPKELFQRLFLELKSYGPKFTDSHNNSLFFTLENASPVFNAFDKIVKRYRDEYSKGAKAREIDALRKKLEDLLKS